MRLELVALTLVLAALPLAPSHAQLARAPQVAKGAESKPASADVRDLSALLAPLRTKSDVPGVTAAIVHAGKLVALGADGVRKRGSDVAITAGDKMHLGSCTKAMTATLAGLFVEAGKLQWSTTLGEFFPDVEMLPAWRAVTLEQLLTHTSGAPADLNPGGLWSNLWKQKGSHVDQRRELLLGVVKREPESPPGTKFLYSNAGFAIAGHMLETLAKKPWEELIQEQLFTPLGITTAGFGAPGTKGKLDQPLGHSGERAIEVGPGDDNPPAIGPAGTAHMAVADWAKFVALHLDAENGRARLLKPETFTKLHTVPEGADSHYALGWGVQSRPWADGVVLTHSGSNTMWFCVTWLAPKKDFAVLVCCNAAGDGAGKFADGVAWALIQDELKELGPQKK